MDRALFERIAQEEFSNVPERFARRIRNVALLLEEDPDAAVRAKEGLAQEETLLGIYHGIPASERGAFYGGVLPDTITLYRLPLLGEAALLRREGRASDEEGAVRLAIRETLWHEIAHYFGMSEEVVHAREGGSTNYFGARDGYAQAVGPSSTTSSERSMLQRASRTANRFSSLTAHMAKTSAILFGVIFVLAGLLGFVSNPLIGTNAIFETNTADNLLHLLVGSILILVAYIGPDRSGRWLKVFGITYLFVAAIGFFSFSPLLGLFEANRADNWLHAVLGTMLILASVYGKEPRKPDIPPLDSRSAR